jgi:hypothetical protein
MKSSRIPALAQSRDTHRACQLASAAVAGPNRPGPFPLVFGWEGFVEEVRTNRPPAALVEVLPGSDDGGPNPDLLPIDGVGWMAFQDGAGTDASGAATRSARSLRPTLERSRDAISNTAVDQSHRLMAPSRSGPCGTPGPRGSRRPRW